MQADSTSLMDLRTIAEWNVKPLILATGGVSQVTIIGGDLKQFQVLANPQKMSYFNVSLQEIADVCKGISHNSMGGVVRQFGNEYVVRGIARTADLEELGNSFIKTRNDKPVRIRDVAEVKIGSAVKMGHASENGKPAVIISISKQPHINTLDVTEKIERNLQILKNTLPPDVRLDTEIFRQANFIKTSVNNVRNALMEGGIFVIIILFIFLGSFRTTIISLTAIPLSLLGAIIVLKIFGLNINTMSLGGMTIAIGSLVDDAIIDVENVYKRLRENVRKPKDEREPTLTVVRDASVEIRSSIIIATLIIIVSFIPLFFLGGMEGRLLQPLGIAFVTSVLTSLIVAVTVTPVLCSYFLKNEKLLNEQAEGTWVERWLQKRYSNVLTRATRVPKTIIGVTVIAFLLSLLVVTQLGRSFLPEFNEGSLVISVVGPPGMSLEESNKTGKLVEEILLDLPEVEVVTRRTGRAELDEHAQGVNAAEIDVPFVLEDKDKEEFFGEVRTKLSIVPGVNITLGQPIAHRIDHMLSGTRANIAIKIFGPDLQRLFEVGKSVEQNIKDIDGLADVAVDQQIEVPQIRIKPKRQILSAYGMTVGDLMEQVDIAYAGEEAGEIYEGQQYFDLVVRYQKQFRDNIETMNTALISLPDGGQTNLGELATIRSVSSPNTINREDVQRKIVIAANVQGRDLRGAVELSLIHI